MERTVLDLRVFVDDTDVPDHVKMIMLKNGLKNQPLKLISNLGYASAQDTLALQCLNQQFGDHQSLHWHLQDILQADPVREGDIFQLENFVDCLQDLEA